MIIRKLLLLACLFILLSSCRIVSISAVSSPIICFTFDDQHEGVHRAALPLMEQFGFRGTCFVNTGRLGLPDFMTVDDIKSLHDTYSWEIGGHSLMHEDLTELDYQQATHAICTDFLNLQNWGLNPRSFALPGGDCPEAYYPILRDLYRNIRGSNDLAMHVPLNRLGLGYFPYQSFWNASVVKDRINRGIADNEDLIIIGFHQIDGETNPYGTNCQIREFTEILQYVHDLDLQVLTLDEAVQELTIN